MGKIIVIFMVVVWGGEVMFSLSRIADALEKMVEDNKRK